MYPNLNQQGGFTPQYPQQQQGEGYPPQQAGSGFPPQYPQQQQQGGSGYPPPQQGGYPPQQGGYPPQQGGYPPQQGGYPSQQQASAYGGYGAGSSGLFDGPGSSGGGGAPPPPSVPPYYPNPQQQQQYQQQQPPQQQYQQQTPPQSSGQPSLIPFQPFNPADDAKKLYKAMKGFGTDEATLIDVLCKRTFEQRAEIMQTYKASHGKDLLKNIKSEVSGNFEKLFVSLLHPSAAHLDAVDLKHAIDGMGTNEVALIDIVCTKDSHEMQALQHAYRTVYGKDLEKEVGGDTSGYFKRFLVSLIAARRSTAPPDHAKAVAQAKELYEGGAKRMGTNEMVFNRIFAIESFAHLRLVFDQYRQLTGKDIESAIKSEMSGDVEAAFIAVARTAKNPASYWSMRLHDSMAGMGTHDRNLRRIMAQRAELDMLDVKQQFQSQYNKTLESFIKSDCSGDYKRGLLCLAGDMGWR